MPRPGVKVLVVQLFVDLFLQTDGSTSYMYLEQDVPELEELGPFIESMYVMTVTHNRTTNHVWNVAISGSMTGRTWNTPVTIIGSDINANGESPQGLYSTVATYAWRKIKALATCKNSTGSARESAQVSAWLVLIMRS